MKKQDYCLTFRKNPLIFAIIILICTLISLEMPAYSSDFKLLKLNSTSAEQWQTLQSALLSTPPASTPKSAPEVLEENNLFLLENARTVIVPLTAPLSQNTVTHLVSFLEKNGQLIFIAFDASLNPEILELLKEMGIHLSPPLPSIGTTPPTPKAPLFSVEAPFSETAQLFYKPTPNGPISHSAWQKAPHNIRPLAIQTKKGALIFTGWASPDYGDDQRQQVIRQVLNANKNPTPIAQGHQATIILPKIQIKSGPISPPPETLKPSAAYNLMDRTPPFIASVSALPSTKPASLPESPVPDQASENVPERSTEHHQKQSEATPKNAPAQPTFSTLPTQPIKTETTPASTTPVSTGKLSINTPAHSTFSIKHPDPQEEGSATNEDPLFNDALMGEEEDTGLITAIPTTPLLSSNFDFGSYQERIKNLDHYRSWVEDAIEAALQLSLPIPVKKTQQLLLKADLQRARSESAYQRGRTGEGEYAYDEAYSLMNKALVLTTLSSKVEGRAIWLDRGSIVDSKTPQGLKKLIAKLDRSGINVIYFESLNAGFPLYPSELIEQTPLIKGWDPLKVAVDEAHKRGMEIHAWVWCFAVGNTKHNPLIGKTSDYPGPVLEEAKLMSEALQTQSGSIMPPRQTEYWISPASLKGREFLKSVYKEIITGYDVDGLHLDYIRYPFQRPRSQVGYEAVSRQRFHQETGLSVGNGGDFNLKSFVAWKTLQVNTFVKELSDELRGLKPDLKLSAAVFPMKRTQRILAIQQDWETWIEKGWIDTLSPMIYTSSPSLFRSTVRRIIDTADQHAIIYPGVAIFRLDADEMLGHLKAVQESKGLGSTLFAFAHLDDSKQEALHHGPYKTRNAIPPHQDPLYALDTLIQRYQKNFKALAQKGELTVLTQKEAQTLSTQLNQLATLSSQLKDTAKNTHQLDFKILAQLKDTLKTLDEPSQTWLEAELTDRPFRAQLFTEYLMRIKLLLDYAEKQFMINTKTADSTSPLLLTSF